MVKSKLIFFALFVFTIISDQISKYYVITHFSIFEKRSILGSFLNIYYVRNYGIIFGSFSDHPAVVTVIVACKITILLLILCLYFAGAFSLNYITVKTAVIMILGGGVGNLIDHIRLNAVVDFIDMGIGNVRWYTYNIADIYITIGTILLIYFFFSHREFSVKTLFQSPDKP